MTGRLKLGAQVFAVGLVALLLALLIWKVVHGSGKKAAVGKAAPNFTLSRIDGPGKLQPARRVDAAEREVRRRLADLRLVAGALDELPDEEREQQRDEADREDLRAELEPCGHWIRRRR